MKVVGEELVSLCQGTMDDIKKKIEFICKQLTVHSLLRDHRGKRYDPYVMSDAVNL